MKTAAANHRELTDFILGSRLVVGIDPTAIQWRAIQAFRRTIELHERWWVSLRISRNKINSTIGISLVFRAEGERDGEEYGTGSQ
jgi:hypothetical protein